MVRNICILITLVCSLNLQAQKIEPKFTFNVELGLPVSTANKPFDDIMQGLACASLYGQYSFPFHLNVGLGGRYSLFTIDEFSVPSPVFGELHTVSAFLKVGWDKFHNDRLATDFHVKVGYSYHFASTDLNKTLGLDPRQMESLMVEPTAALILAANEHNSYRWSIGYSFQGFGFSPGTLGLPSNEGYELSEFDRITQFLLVGFGYTYYFNGKKE